MRMLSVVAGIVAAVMFSAPAQAFFSMEMGESEGRVEDLPLSAECDLEGFALVHISHAAFVSDAGTDPATSDVYTTINEVCRRFFARLLFRGPAGGGVRVRYVSVPVSSAQEFVQDLKWSIQRVLTNQHSDRVWRIHKLKVDILFPEMALWRIEFRDSRWPWSTKTILPDLKFSFWDVFNPARTTSFKPLFGCGAKALAEKLRDPSFRLPETVKLQLAALAGNPRTTFDLYLWDPILSGSLVKVRTRGFEFQCD